MTKPQCPTCGKPVYVRGHSRGKQRYSCPENHWHGTQPVNLDSAERAGIDMNKSIALHQKIRASGGRRRYVITAAQNATPVNEAFFASLRTYCRANRAQLIVIPYRYKNPTSMWAEEAREDDWWAPELTPYLLATRTPLNDHLTVLADIMAQPTATSPLSGFETLTADKSAIIGHPKLELVTVPTPQNKLPKILTTTGAVTEKNYISAKAGKKAEHHHTFGACAVEIDGDAFHMRQLNAVRDGSFMDLNYEYRGTKRKKVERAAALVMGDSHVEFIDPQVVEATFGRGGLLDVLKPHNLVWHDVHDFYSRNHHHKHEVFINYAKHHAGTDNVEKGLDDTFAFVDKYSRPGVTNVFVASNHPDALARWVKENDPRLDPENCVFWARTFEAMCLGSKMTSSGASTIDPFVFWAQKKLKAAAQSVFLQRDQSFMVEGIELGLHGDKGANGAKGSRRSLSKIGVKTVIGHSHSPGICEGTYQTGTNSMLNLDYTGGPSSWLHTDCVVYANGKRSLINIIDGNWRAP